MIHRIKEKGGFGYNVEFVCNKAGNDVTFSLHDPRTSEVEGIHSFQREEFTETVTKMLDLRVVGKDAYVVEPENLPEVRCEDDLLRVYRDGKPLAAAVIGLYADPDVWEQNIQDDIALLRALREHGVPAHRVNAWTNWLMSPGSDDRLTGTQIDAMARRLAGLGIDPVAHGED